MSNPFKPPATVLDELGITEPTDIDIEAIAHHCGATILTEPLEGCAARIIGAGDKALITIDEHSRPERQRFSAAHELGHWMRDRGKTAFSCTADQFVDEWGDDNPERRANRYGADLLMPSAMFKPRAHGLPGTFESARDLALTFGTSLTAAAIKFVSLGTLPTMLVLTERAGRKWFFRSTLVPEQLWPTTSPGSGSVATKILARTCAARPGPETVDADDWIDHHEAHRYCVVEDSIGMPRGRVLTLLWWKDEDQILAFDDDDDSVAGADVPTFGRRRRRR